MATTRSTEGRAPSVAPQAAFFKALGDATRLRLTVLLATHGETCVCMLAEALAAPDFRISRHLTILKAAGLVESRRDGTWIYYKLNAARDRLEERLQRCLRDCFADHPVVQEDLRRLSKASCGGRAKTRRAGGRRR